MNGDNFSYLLMFYLLGAVFQTVPTQAEFTCSSLRDDHKCSKSITDNSDATDLFFSRIFFIITRINSITCLISNFLHITK